MDATRNVFMNHSEEQYRRQAASIKLRSSLQGRKGNTGQHGEQAVWVDDVSVPRDVRLKCTVTTGHLFYFRLRKTGCACDDVTQM
jgi:hypothetical protein